MTRSEGYKLIEEMVSSPNLKRHALAVEAIMRSLARKFGEDEEEWGLVGLLHDADYEIVEKNPSRHTLVTEEKLKALGVSEQITNAIKAHHDTIKPNRENNLESAVYCADELSGLITACALVQPDKRLSSVTNDSVMRKFRTKGFAAGARRDSIQACEKELGIPLEEFVKIGLEAMQSISNELGL